MHLTCVVRLNESSTLASFCDVATKVTLSSSPKSTLLSVETVKITIWLEKASIVTWEFSNSVSQSFPLVVRVKVSNLFPSLLT